MPVIIETDIVWVVPIIMVVFVSFTMTMALELRQQKT